MWYVCAAERYNTAEALLPAVERGTWIDAGRGDVNEDARLDYEVPLISCCCVMMLPRTSSACLHLESPLVMSHSSICRDLSVFLVE